MREEVVTIANLLKESCHKNDKIKGYVFGSASRSKKFPNDIDILIIYDDQNVPEKLRKLIKGTGDMPVHLIFLTSQEETETNFITTQCCISIF